MNGNVNLNDERDERPGEGGEDSEAPFELREIDDEAEGEPPRGEGLGAAGQLIAALGISAVLGLLIVGALAVLSWLFA
ncbi:MAG: hypothetical protein AB7O37_19505 [Vicinamibacteria bacterium]